MDAVARVVPEKMTTYCSAAWRELVHLLTLFVGSCILLGCTTPKPPRPIAVGPDSGWVRAPVKFAALNTDGTPAGPCVAFRWGDGSPGGMSQCHEYQSSGEYSITCWAYIVPSLGEPVYSDPSEPHVIRILGDTMAFPDSLGSTFQIGPGRHVWGCVVPDGGRLYFARAEVDSVSVVETGTNSILAVIPVQDSPVCCISSHSGERIYVANARSRTVSVVRTLDNVIADTIGMAYRPGCMALTPDDSLLYVGHSNAERVSVYRTDSDSCVARIDVQGTPSFVAVRPGGEYYYVGSESDNLVTVVRTADNTVVLSAKVLGGPTDCQFSPGGETAYVACPSHRNLALLEASSLDVLSKVCYDSMYFSDVRYVTMLSDSSCLYLTAAGEYSSRLAVLRRSDNYLLRNYCFSGAGVAGPTILLPDRSRVYIPTSTGIRVLERRSTD